MKLYHFSNNSVDVLKVENFGRNIFTLGDKKIGVNRLFFYIEPKPLESYFLYCKYLYVVEVDKKELYDLRLDKKGIAKKFYPNISALLEYCRSNFKGVIYNSGGYTIVNLFNDVKPLEKLELQKEG